MTSLAIESRVSIRTKWVSLDGKNNKEIPIFTQNRAFLRNLIPLMPTFENKDFKSPMESTDDFG